MRRIGSGGCVPTWLVSDIACSDANLREVNLNVGGVMSAIPRRKKIQIGVDVHLCRLLGLFLSS